MNPNLPQMLTGIIEDEPNIIANLANMAALLNEELSDINWVGFYLYEEETDQLVLGPFQGRIACIRIDNGKGVCGTAFQMHSIQRIEDVHAFPGHIACDERSRSELVVPFNLVSIGISGVLDIDSPSLDRFKEEDESIIQACVKELENHYRL